MFINRELKNIDEDNYMDYFGYFMDFLMNDEGLKNEELLKYILMGINNEIRTNKKLDKLIGLITEIYNLINDIDIKIEIIEIIIKYYVIEGKNKLKLTQINRLYVDYMKFFVIKGFDLEQFRKSLEYFLTLGIPALKLYFDVKKLDYNSSIYILSRISIVDKTLFNESVDEMWQTIVYKRMIFKRTSLLGELALLANPPCFGYLLDSNIYVKKYSNYFDACKNWIEQKEVIENLNEGIITKKEYNIFLYLIQLIENNIDNEQNVHNLEKKFNYLYEEFLDGRDFLTVMFMLPKSLPIST